MAHSIVIFGASGDLTSRKLIPALYQLFRKDRLPPGTNVIGVSRRTYTHDQWRTSLAESTSQFLGDGFDPESWQAFANQVFYHPGDVTSEEDVRKLDGFLHEREGGEACARVYYLSTAPQLYATAVARLGAAGMTAETDAPRRIVIEKPFGTDLASAQALNRAVHNVFDESQVYRIDHYLGKETVQNMLVLRFANSIFEPLWNRNYIDHVQITVAEEVSVGRRGGYYDGSGILRDMFQNHILQLMTITAMENPGQFTADLVRDEKVKTLRAVRPMSPESFKLDTLRAQYEGYRDEEGVPKTSETATFAALKLWIDNWRWKGVPFYLRSGKAMSCRTTQIVIQFHDPPHMLFDGGPSAASANRLVIQIQPAEGIQLNFLTKVPDAGMRLRMTDLDFRFRREFSGSLPDAYQRLLLDAVNGDASLFARSDEVERAWGIIDPILAAWRNGDGPALHTYPSGEWGAAAATDWMQQQGREWFDVCPVLH